MGSSTTTIQSIVDYAMSLGELTPVLPTAGFSVNTALTIATDVMNDLLSQRFNWRWNRMLLPPFWTISWQQDYAGRNSTYIAPIGYLEKASWTDINNTAYPKPTYYIEVTREIERTSISGNPPAKLDWDFNKNLMQAQWPGPYKQYVYPLGALITPTNPNTNIRDVNGNILVLTGWGVTGSTPPQLPAGSSEGTMVLDGTCTWTVADPESQGFRIMPLPPQQGVVYQIDCVAQKKAPPPFTSMQQQIDPVPDDDAHWFREGFIAYSYRMSPNPQMRALFPNQRQFWMAAIEGALKKGDRELITNAAFIPDRSVVAPQGGIDIGPANPFLYNVWPGR